MNHSSAFSHLCYTSDQVRSLDRSAIVECEIPGYELMCSAGAACFSAIQARWRGCGALIVVCGTGNNGGDGFVIARLAKSAGMDVQVWLIGDRARIKGDALRAFDDAITVGVNVVVDPPIAPAQDAGVVVVDALLGTGLKGAVKQSHTAAIEWINACPTPVVAVDIPSGLCSDTGVDLGAVAKADLTVTFIGRKRGLYTGAAPEYCGDIIFDDLDVPATVYESVAPSAGILGFAPLAPRPRTAHKGFAGHVLVIGGDHGMGGAVLMAASAAARSGAGLVSVATRAGNVAAINASRPEVMAHGVETISALDALLERADVVVIGPGLGRSAWSGQMLFATQRSGLPAVLDADALNLMSSGMKRTTNAKRVLTPHPGEAAGLLGVSVREVMADRFAAASAIADRYSATVVLKGAGTLVTSAETITGICTAGNPGMASGGMGDVLSGVIGALIAQGLSAHDAAATGVCAHALAADRAVSEEGERGLLATDLLPWIRRLLNGQGL